MKPKPKFKGKPKKGIRKGGAKGPKTPKIPKQFQQNPLITYSKKEITENLDKFPGLMKTLAHAYEIQIKYTQEYSFFPEDPPEKEKKASKKNKAAKEKVENSDNNVETESNQDVSNDSDETIETKSTDNKSENNPEDTEKTSKLKSSSDNPEAKNEDESKEDESVEIADDYWFCNDMTTAVILMKYLDQFPGRVEWNQKPFAL